jgi:hypothetical protein
MKLRFLNLRQVAWLGTSVALCWLAIYWRGGSDAWALAIVASLPWTAYWLATDPKLREQIADDPQWLLIYMGISALVVAGVAALGGGLLAAAVYAARSVGQTSG